MAEVEAGIAAVIATSQTMEIVDIKRQSVFVWLHVVRQVVGDMLTILHQSRRDFSSSRSVQGLRNGFVRMGTSSRAMDATMHF
ncbi:hypothetical protein QF000_007875 [Paraburkholderia atlantica]|uniref:hypothetical protein n=1 Tax=Paraburkholderia atlantica TaxID=2654982 RepID=UPI003D1FE76E